MQAPPVIPPPRQPQLPRPKPRNRKVEHAIFGSIFLVLGIGIECTGKAPVPFYQVFQLVPIAIGLGIATAILRNKHEIAGVVSLVLLEIGVLIYTVVVFCSLLPLFLLGSAHLFTLSLLLWQREQS